MRLAPGGLDVADGVAPGEYRDRSERLPELLDARRLRAELGISRAAAEKIMRRLPVVQPDCVRKVYVKRSDVAAYLEAMTFEKGEVPS